MPRDADHLQPLQDQPLPRAARALSCDHLRRDEQQLEQQQQQDQVCVHMPLERRRACWRALRSSRHRAGGVPAHVAVLAAATLAATLAAAHSLSAASMAATLAATLTAALAAAVLAAAGFIQPVGGWGGLGGDSRRALDAAP